jgi:hypothetical protein
MAQPEQESTLSAFLKLQANLETMNPNPNFLDSTPCNIGVQTLRKIWWKGFPSEWPHMDLRYEDDFRSCIAYMTVVGDPKNGILRDIEVQLMPKALRGKQITHTLMVRGEKDSEVAYRLDQSLPIFLPFSEAYLPTEKTLAKRPFINLDYQARPANDSDFKSFNTIAAFMLLSINKRRRANPMAHYFMKGTGAQIEGSESIKDGTLV